MTTDIIVQNSPKITETHNTSLLSPQASQTQFPHHDLQIIKRLSKGRFPIYLTSSQTNTQNYAMKVFPDIIKDSDEYYNNEIRFASLSHPNVINIVDYEKDRILFQKNITMRVTYVLSEFAPHGDFFDFIIQHKQEMDEKLARTYFRQLIEGIEYLHSLGVAHLDLKPENLLIGADFNLKIADFDLSYVSGDEEVLSRGTRFYRAPELYNSSSSNKNTLESLFSADIYSAGIVLFILKTAGVYPHAENQIFEGVNFTEVMHKNHRKFWSTHCHIQAKEKSFFDSNFKELFHKMVKANPSKRLTIRKIKQSKWYNGPVYTQEELSLRMKTILKC